MMKRNDGYALAYVMVVLLVLAAIAIAVMTLSIHVLNTQQSTIDRMQEKYAAQGLVEQVVAQLEHANTTELSAVLDKYQRDESNTEQTVYCTPNPNNTYTIVASSAKTVVTAEFTLDPVTKTTTSGDAENPVTTTTTIGHTVTYLSYSTEVAP